MKKKALLVLVFGLVMIGATNSLALAQEQQIEDGTTVGSVSVESVETMDPDAPFFGLRWAWQRVSENIQLWTTRSEERQVELEARFATREQALIERIESSDNPERLEKLLEQLRERQDKRLERLNSRIEKISEKRTEQAGKLLEKLEELEERRFEASISAKRRMEENREDAREITEERREELKNEVEKRREELKKRMEERRERFEERVRSEEDERDEVEVGTEAEE